MNETDTLNLHNIRSVIDDMNEANQVAVRDAAQSIRATISYYREHGKLAFALVGAELTEIELGAHTCSTPTCQN